MTKPLLAVTKYAFTAVAATVGLYACLLGLLTTAFVQSHVIYLHKIQMPWFKDLDTPELFGFLHNQVTPFSIPTLNNESLYAWHVIPPGLYRQHEARLVQKSAGRIEDITSRTGFQLLKSDPKALLVIHFHGAAGTVASGYRPPNYRALSAGAPDRIHVLTFDYRGFGRSSNAMPSEPGVIADSIAVLEWAIDVAGIPAARILIFGQSLGTAVSLAVSEHFASRDQPVVFAGIVLVAPFVDAAALAATYRIAGVIPITSPLAKFPRAFRALGEMIGDKWVSRDRIARFVRIAEAGGMRYRITFVHAEDDWDVPSHHSQTLFWHAVNATTATGIGREELDRVKVSKMVDLGAAGTVMEWKSENGFVREEILKSGLHDVIMGNSVVTLAVSRIFGSVGLI
ncbi:alpha/beta-Hydrolase [Glarea lozoyensis ATCC 20868]|uniref:Alpha/beta-Hydrolase n=1 Tax=Glarea lozoyensis (strain ATCC 20868 / MF5171) TaxID=1116229 RepID=S3DGY9_GLAL2|nr:alpha/beta-Hydrolase [Glarea lozoyensis ATCC 20868]EPE36399.1 alpha/beta-Hydrolase [Glarea lozoyensis ATCC 20868]